MSNNGDLKFWVRGHSRSLKMAPFGRSHISCLYHFRDKGRHWSKISIFHTPPAFDAAVKGTPSNLKIIFRTEKIEWPWLPEGKKV